MEFRLAKMWSPHETHYDGPRDDNGIAILDPAVWVFDDTNNCFLNKKDLSVLTFDVATHRMPNNSGGRNRTPSPTRLGATRPSPAAAPFVPQKQAAAVTEVPPIGPLNVFGNGSLGYGVYKFAVPGPSAAFWESVIKEAEAEAQPFNHMGTHTFLASAAGRALEGRLSEALRAQHPGVAGVKCTSAFVVNYSKVEASKNKGPLGHDAHADRSDLTLNLCLGRSFTGGALLFAEPALPTVIVTEDSPGDASAATPPAGGFYPMPRRVMLAEGGGPFPVVEEKPVVKEGDVVVPHSVGEAVLHLGALKHSTFPITHGQRINLICFFAVEWNALSFLELPKDVQRHFASFLPGRDVLALSATCRAVRGTLETHDVLWERLLTRHSMYASVKEEAAALRKKHVSGKRVYVAALELVAIQGLGRALAANAPRIMMKETYEMSMAREARIAAANEETVCRLGLHKDPAVLAKVRRTSKSCCDSFIMLYCRRSASRSSAEAILLLQTTCLRLDSRAGSLAELVGSSA
jgi:hypothetical protein